jgi:hypothetical protein
MKKRAFLKGVVFRSAVLLLSCSLFVSCGRSYTDTSLYEKTGQIKPTVAVLPCIVKENEIDVSWDLSQEFTEELRRRVFESPKVYLEKGDETIEVAKALLTPNPKLLPTAPLKELEHADFVLVTEIVEQRQTPYGFPSLQEHKGHLEESGAILALTMRVRVIDRRHGTAKVVLQELMETKQVVAKPYLQTDYQRVKWGTEPFLHTPLGMAHSKMLREVVAHVESYILASK